MNDIFIEDLTNLDFINDDLVTLLESTVQTTLKTEGIKYDVILNISIVSEEEIRSLNNEHRSIDKVTDVLSFPVVNLLTDDITSADFYEDKLILGDVIICAKRAKAQSVEYNHSLEREFSYLTCHSVLHLIGYDHENDDERDVMREKEENVMNLLNLKR